MKRILITLVLLLLASPAIAREVKQSTATNVMIFMTDSTDHITGKASLTLTITASKDGGAFGSITPTVTDRGNGWYNIALTTAHTDTVGDLCLHLTGTGADPSDLKVNVVANLASGVVVTTNNDKTGYTASTVSDKTGYSLTQAFPTNFSTLVINGSGYVTSSNAGSGATAAEVWGYSTRSLTDKSGFALTQAFPTNFSSMAITAGGAVTAGTVSDKTGYALTQAFPSNFNTLAITAGGAVTAGTVSDKTGYTVSTVQDKTGYTASTVTDKTGYSLTTPPPTAADIWANSTRSLTDKAGFSLATSPLDDTVEGSYTMRKLLRLIASALMGKVTGGGTSTITFRDLGDTKNRIVEIVDSNGNRSSVTLNGD